MGPLFIRYFVLSTFHLDKHRIDGGRNDRYDKRCRQELIKPTKMTKDLTQEMNSEIYYEHIIAFSLIGSAFDLLFAYFYSPVTSTVDMIDR